ncbi:hypothetical protein GPECTOR_473g399 [Gonium pectorale]|uniref:Uncharacterized protein n=1 Tax=Gonium pectorale TaxID=33097 RepID=A0A150FUZ6_GONPE|nr:hypothetical protein GPECTOR_473g399 [Gonium pectorale]|eukprot:KXZ41426.1 hypothetical protein GPECTOR_473g399 [Gonium pectorale]
MVTGRPRAITDFTSERVLEEAISSRDGKILGLEVRVKGAKPSPANYLPPAGFLPPSLSLRDRSGAAMEILGDSRDFPIVEVEVAYLTVDASSSFKYGRNVILMLPHVGGAESFPDGDYVTVTGGVALERLEGKLSGALRAVLRRPAAHQRLVCALGATIADNTISCSTQTVLASVPSDGEVVLQCLEALMNVRHALVPMSMFDGGVEALLLKPNIYRRCGACGAPATFDQEACSLAGCGSTQLESYVKAKMVACVPYGDVMEVVLDGGASDALWSDTGGQTFSTILSRDRAEAASQLVPVRAHVTLQGGCVRSAERRPVPSWW